MPKRPTRKSCCAFWVMYSRSSCSIVWAVRFSQELASNSTTQNIYLLKKENKWRRFRNEVNRTCVASQHSFYAVVHDLQSNRSLAHRCRAARDCVQCVASTGRAAAHHRALGQSHLDVQDDSHPTSRR